jgi:hypothetical protein
LLLLVIAGKTVSGEKHDANKLDPKKGADALSFLDRQRRV